MNSMGGNFSGYGMGLIVPGFGGYGGYGAAAGGGYGVAYGAPVGPDAGSVKGALDSGYVLTTALSGETREDVRQLQAILASIGFLTARDVDGRYGPKTAAGVSAYQAANGLTADGKAGRMTLTALLDPASFHTARKTGVAAATVKASGGGAPAIVPQTPYTMQAGMAPPPPPAAQGIDWGQVAIWSAFGLGGMLMLGAAVEAARG